MLAVLIPIGRPRGVHVDDGQPAVHQGLRHQPGDRGQHRQVRALVRRGFEQGQVAGVRHFRQPFAHPFLRL